MFRVCLVLLLITALSFCASAAPLPADQVFSDSTKGFFAIRNFQEFVKQWEKTQFGQLVNDPLMDNFKEEVQKQLDGMKSTFGLSFEGIFSLPTGEVAFGMIHVPDQVPGYVLMMDVAGKRTETNEHLANLTQRLVAAGVEKTTEEYRERQVTVLTFPAQEAPQALRSARVEIMLEPIERRAHYLFWEDVFVASDQLHLLHLIADRLAGQSDTKSLAEVEAYQVAMKRCIGDMPDGTQPTIRWYIEPLDYGESVQSLLQSRNSAAQSRRDRPSVFSVLRQQGFDAIRGIGGVISVKTEEQETVYRTFIHTQRPYRLAMQMFNFPDDTNFTPPTWMPGDLARCTMFYVDPLAIFDNFGTLFDTVIMPGEEGVWRDILKGLEEDPHGPQINIREELVAHLGNRVLGMSRYETPITVKSESIVVAVELKSGQQAAMLAGIEKLFGTDPEMQATEHNSYKIWHRKPQEDIIAPIDFGIPIFFEDQPRPVNAVPEAAASQSDQSDPIFPEGGVVVAKGCLFVSTNIEYLKVILDRLDTEIRSSIGDEVEYKRVNQIFASMGLTDKPHFFQFFAKTYETLRPTYEMIRLDRMAQSQALLAKVLNEILSPEEESGIRRQIIDGSTLPEFDKVQHYFGKVGIYGMSEDDGYFIKGFTLERE